MTTRIVGLGGSVAARSRSRAALRIALGGAERAGAETLLLDIRELDLPLYNPELEKTPAAAAVSLIEESYGADGLLWSSPMYQGTISGAFKNALDWLHPLGRRDPPHLTDKVVGLISTAGGTHGLQAVNTMEFAVRALRAWAVPYVVPIAQAPRLFDPEERIQDEGVERQLELLGSEVARVSERFAASRPEEPEAECLEAAERVAAVV